MHFKNECILQVHSGHIARVTRWLVWAALTGALAAVLCLGSQNDGLVPVNKNLWSISLVLVTSCFAFILLSVLYVVIDVRKLWKGQPFFYAGMNSILLYCGHSVGYNIFPFHFVIGDMRTHADKLTEAITGPLLWIISLRWRIRAYTEANRGTCRCFSPCPLHP